MSNLMPVDAIDGSRIRREWHDGQWYYSIIDMVAVLLDLDNKAAKNYYNVFKSRLSREGNQTITICNRLKLVAEDGKRRLTDVVNTEQALRVLQSIPSPKLEPLKLWLAQVGTERFQETADPELGLFRSLDRAADQYRLAGKTDSWITARVEGIVTRKAFVDALHDAVLDAPDSLYAQTTDKLYKGLWERTTTQLRKALGINPRANPRDHFGKYALIYTRLAEEVSTERLKNVETVPMSVAMEIIWKVATLFHSQAQALSEALGYDLVTEKPLLPTGRQPRQLK
jgi:hypothetical protein